VVNFDLPSHIDDYVHRIGRTGRAGNTGLAVSFFTRNNANIARELQKVLLENFQDIPEWLQHYRTLPRSSGGSKGHGGGGDGGSFASRDFRSNDESLAPFFILFYYDTSFTALTFPSPLVVEMTLTIHGQWILLSGTALCKRRNRRRQRPLGENPSGFTPA